MKLTLEPPLDYNKGLHGLSIAVKWLKVAVQPLCSTKPQTSNIHKKIKEEFYHANFISD